MTTELTLRFQAAPAVLFLQTQLPARMVVDLNKYLDTKHNKGGERSSAPSNGPLTAALL